MKPAGDQRFSDGVRHGTACGGAQMQHVTITRQTITALEEVA